MLKIGNFNTKMVQGDLLRDLSARFIFVEENYKIKVGSLRMAYIEDMLRICDGKMSPPDFLNKIKVRYGYNSIQIIYQIPYTGPFYIEAYFFINFTPSKSTL